MTRLALAGALVLSLAQTVDAAEWVSPGITLGSVADLPEGETLNLRAAPSPSAKVVGTLTDDAGIDVIRCLRDPYVADAGPNWCCITWGSAVEGWANARFLIVHGLHEYKE